MTGQGHIGRDQWCSDSKLVLPEPPADFSASPRALDTGLQMFWEPQEVSSHSYSDPSSPLNLRDRPLQSGPPFPELPLLSSSDNLPEPPGADLHTT